MKKSIIFVGVVILFLSTYKYHLGKIPVINMYTHQYFNKYKLSLAGTSTPLFAKALILFGAEINPISSSRRIRQSYSPLFSQIKAYNDCFFHPYNRTKETLSKCIDNHLEIIDILLANGADVKGALFQSRYVPILKSLLRAGANIEERDSSGITPLFYHTKYMYKYNTQNRNDVDTDAFNFLISKGANIQVKDNQEQTLLHVAKYSEAISYLITKGLDINAKDKFGNTPIFYRAKELDELKPVKTLVENGADINIKNSKGQTPLEYILASKRYPNKINKNAAYLLKKGAKINDEIYVNSLHIKKPTKLADTLWQVKIMNMYKDINSNDDYNIYEAIYKMNLQDFPNNFDRWKTLEYVINLDFIQTIITSYNKDIKHVQNSLGNSPLHYVVRYSEKLTDYFIEQGVDVNTLNKKGQPPLFFCENIAIAKKLINQGADIHIKDNQQKSALDYVQNPELLNYLVAKGLSAKEKDINKQSPLINYVKKNSSFYIRTTSDGLKYDKHYKSIKVFLDSGANINEKLPYADETILFLVNDTKLLDKLIEDGINIEAKNKMGQTALFKLLRFPRVKVGKRLIEKGANVMALDKEKNTLLHFVFDDKLATIIIDKGVDVNSKNKLGDTPLHTLVRQDLTFSRESKVKTFEVFIKKGADVNSQNNKGQTPLMFAIKRYNRFYIKKLIEAGADVKLKDKQGNTILHYAAQSARNEDDIKYILKIGSDIDINTQNKIGQTMLDKTYRQDVKNYLIDKGAKFGKYRY